MVIRVLFVAALAIIAARPAWAEVRLRPFGILTSSLVRLSDLFEGTGSAGGRILGPGPSPGQQITVPAAQLAAIAAEFGVDWHPRSPNEQVVLERPGRLLHRSEAVPALKSALTAEGAPVECGVVLSEFSAPDVPPGAKISIAVRALDYDRASRRFSAVLSVSAREMEAVEMPVAGRVEPMTRLLVATRFLAPGSLVEGSDLKVSEVPASQVSGAVAHVPRQAEGLEVAHALARGAPVLLSDLVAPPLVKRGEQILITLTSPGLSLTEQGIALSAGAAGDAVRVLNPASHALLAARVTGPGEVSVTLGSLPLRGPDRLRHGSYPEYAAQ